MLEVIQSKSFKKTFKKIIKHKDFKISEFEYVINKLRNNLILDIKYKDHKLSGDYSGYRECHIQNDILLIYSIENNNLILYLSDIGSHSELF